MGKFIVASLLLFGGFSSYASDVICSKNMCYQTQIKRIYVKKTQTFLWFKADQANLDCKLDGKKYIELEKSDNYESMYSLALSSHLHEKKITAKITPNSGGYCRVEYLYLD